MIAAVLRCVHHRVGLPVGKLKRIHQQAELACFARQGEVDPALIGTAIDIGKGIGRVLARRARRKLQPVELPLHHDAVGPQAIGQQR